MEECGAEENEHCNAWKSSHFRSSSSSATGTWVSDTMCMADAGGNYNVEDDILEGSDEFDPNAGGGWNKVDEDNGYMCPLVMSTGRYNVSEKREAQTIHTIVPEPSYTNMAIGKSRIIL